MSHTRIEPGIQILATVAFSSASGMDGTKAPMVVPTIMARATQTVRYLAKKLIWGELPSSASGSDKDGDSSCEWIIGAVHAPLSTSLGEQHGAGVSPSFFSFERIDNPDGRLGCSVAAAVVVVVNVAIIITSPLNFVETSCFS